MAPNKRKLTQLGDILRQQISNHEIQYQRFHIPDTAAYVSLSYRNEVSSRGLEYIENPDMEERLTQVGLWLENGKGTTGLYLCGNPGNGKTTVIKALKNIIFLSETKDPQKRVRSAYEGNTYSENPRAYLCVYTSLEICQLYINNARKFDEIKKCSLLAIDDLGIEPVEVMQYGNLSSPIIELLYWRYENQLFTIISSNLPAKNIKERYGERIYDRMCEMMTVISFPDVSFRKKQI